MGDVILGIDFKPKKPTEAEKLLAISYAMAADDIFADYMGNDREEYFRKMSIQERVRRSIYHGAGLPYPETALDIAKAVAVKRGWLSPAQIDECADKD